MTAIRPSQASEAARLLNNASPPVLLVPESGGGGSGGGSLERSRRGFAGSTGPSNVSRGVCSRLSPPICGEPRHSVR